MKANFFRTELELGHCLRLPEEGPCECDLYLTCAKFVTTPEYAPRLRERRLTKTGEDWFCFAGLWRPATGDVPEAFTLLTTAPGPDVAPIHDRQMVVLERADWIAWLDLSQPEAELLQSLPAGSLHVEQVR